MERYNKKASVQSFSHLVSCGCSFSMPPWAKLPALDPCPPPGFRPTDLNDEDKPGALYLFVSLKGYFTAMAPDGKLLGLLFWLSHWVFCGFFNKDRISAVVRRGCLEADCGGASVSWDSDCLSWAVGCSSPYSDVQVY